MIGKNSDPGLPLSGILYYWSLACWYANMTIYPQYYYCTKYLNSLVPHLNSFDSVFLLGTSQTTSYSTNLTSLGSFLGKCIRVS